MRHLASAILGLLMVFGPAFSGPGHVHAAQEQDRANGLHVDHVHPGASHGEHHAGHHSDHVPAVEVAADHAGDDAVTLNWSGTRAMPKRALPGLAASAIPIESPETPRAAIHHAPRIPLRAPPLDTRPPGRAPPA
jgi:hypothetical protein